MSILAVFQLRPPSPQLSFSIIHEAELFNHTGLEVFSLLCLLPYIQ
jgi:hypothetical protein